MAVDFTPAPLDRDDRVYIAGHRGLVGSAVQRKFEAEGFTDLVGRTSSELDLKDRGAVFDFFAEERPKHVVLAAAKVGGILANDTYPHDFLSENLQIQVNVMDAAVAHGVERLVFLGSSCIYPKLAEQPIHEDSLLTGHLEPTNDAYAIAKIAGILQVQAVRRQHGLPGSRRCRRTCTAGRQLLAEGIARPAGAHPPLRRGRAAGCRSGRELGDRTRVASSCTSTTWPQRSST